MERRFTPAARKPGRRSRSTVLGFTSSVTSTSSRAGAKAERTASTSRATDSGASSEGVPPPR
jgi:hypothetical protein